MVLPIVLLLVWKLSLNDLLNVDLPYLFLASYILNASEYYLLVFIDVSSSSSIVDTECLLLVSYGYRLVTVPSYTRSLWDRVLF